MKQLLIKIKDRETAAKCITKMYAQKHNFEVKQTSEETKVIVYDLPEKLELHYLSEFDYAMQLKDILSFTGPDTELVRPEAQPVHMHLMLWNKAFSDAWHSILPHRRTQITNLLGFYPGTVSEDFFFRSVAEYRVVSWLEDAILRFKEREFLPNDYQVRAITSLPKGSVRTEYPMEA